jgi:recombination protein RecT
MAVGNQLVGSENRNFGAKTMSQYMGLPNIQKMLLSSLSSEKAKQKFVTNLVSLTSVKPELQDCDYASVVSGGLVAHSLDLPLSPSLGLAYLVPFKDKNKGRTGNTRPASRYHNW